MFEANAEYASGIHRLAVRQFVARATDSTPSAPPLWAQLCDGLGLSGILVPERFGGQGGDLGVLAAAVFELGRAGVSGPAVASAGLAATVLARIDPDDSFGAQQRIAEGVVVVLAGLGGPGVGYADGSCRGDIAFVDAGHYASEFLVVAHDGTSTVLVGVDAAAPGLENAPMRALDPARGLSRLVLDRVPGHVLARGPELDDALLDLWLLGAGLTACDLAGAADRCLDLARDYALTRHQFGRPIGGFQAIKHKLVEMYIELEAARSCAQAVAGTEPFGAPWRRVMSMAKARVGDAAMDVAREAVQVHGGIGFTWEHELAAHFRRITTGRALYGTPAQHRQRIADFLTI